MADDIQFRTSDRESVAAEFGVVLPASVTDEVRVVEQDLRFHRDISFDAPRASGRLFDGVWVFAGDLSVAGGITSEEVDGGMGLLVLGDMCCERWWLTGADVRIRGDLTVERLLIAQYNHGGLHVAGRATAPLALVLDHVSAFAGGFDGILLEGFDEVADALPSAVRGGELDLGRLWSACAAS